MLKVRRRLAVCRADRPPIGLLHHLSRTLIHHWLDGDYHPFHQLGPFAPFAVIRHFRVFMQAFANSVSYQLPDYAVAVLRSEERRVGKSVDLGGCRTPTKKIAKQYSQRAT